MKFFLTIATLLLINISSFAERAGATHVFWTGYYGTGYRWSSLYYNSFSLDRWSVNSKSKIGGYKGLGMRYDFADANNRSFGFRGYFSLNKPLTKNKPVMLLLGAEPTLYKNANGWSGSIFPEFGVHISAFKKPAGISFNILYGYELPLNSETNYTTDPKRLTLKVGYVFKMPQKKKGKPQKRKLNTKRREG